MLLAIIAIPVKLWTDLRFEGYGLIAHSYELNHHTFPDKPGLSDYEILGMKQKKDVIISGLRQGVVAGLCKKRQLQADLGPGLKALIFVSCFLLFLVGPAGKRIWSGEVQAGTL